jgi:hypothetical protein
MSVVLTTTRIDDLPVVLPERAVVRRPAVPPSALGLQDWKNLGNRRNLPLTGGWGLGPVNVL